MALAEALDFGRWGLTTPREYAWLVAKRLASYERFGPLEPWYFLDSQHAFLLSDRWPTGTDADRLLAFARRQDSDDIACFLLSGTRIEGVTLIHAWTPEGYQVLSTYPGLWGWLKHVVEDIADWVETAT